MRNEGNSAATVLAAAAFGPGCTVGAAASGPVVTAASGPVVTAASGPVVTAALLPLPSNAVESWWRAVALGGAGYYARARAEIDRTRRFARGPAPLPREDSGAPSHSAPAHEAVLSLSLSTEASWLRQLGWHRHAAEFDGAALARVPRDSAVSGRDDALCDALIGLAADALGQGRLALGERLLDRCRAVLADPAGRAPSPRIPIRLAWVSAELAMAGGHAERALQAADLAGSLAIEGESVRHQVKSSLLAAAARCAHGDVEAARVATVTVRAQCREQGLLPLEWAAGMLLGAVVGEVERTCVRADVATCAAELARRGGLLREV